MKARKLERILVSHGAPASFLDTVTRVMRTDGKLPIGGRGPNAPDIGPFEAALMMIALAATDVAARAVEGLSRQISLKTDAAAPRFADDLPSALQVALGNPDWARQIAEVRVGRTHAFSQIAYCDGHIEYFTIPGTANPSGVGSTAFRSEGILSGGLIHQVAIELAGYNDHEPEF